MCGIELHNHSNIPLMHLKQLDIVSTTAESCNIGSSPPLLVQSLAPFLVPDMPTEMSTTNIGTTLLEYCNCAEFLDKLLLTMSARHLMSSAYAMGQPGAICHAVKQTWELESPSLLHGITKRLFHIVCAKSSTVLTVRCTSNRELKVLRI